MSMSSARSAFALAVFPSGFSRRLVGNAQHPVPMKIATSKANAYWPK
jgi:hypothetical protein